MGAEIGRTNPPVIDRLFDECYRFDFFQAMRLLAQANPGRQLISGLGSPADRIVRIQAQVSSNFPASAIHTLSRGDAAGKPARMIVTFMGLTGPSGVLPSCYTEHLIERRFAGDHGSAVFFDLFNHRFVSLFYRAWEKHNFPVAYERELLNREGERRFTQFLFDLIGMGTPGLQKRLDVPDECLLLYAGLIAQRPRSASALGGLLRDFFGVPVEIQQFAGRWFSLEQSDLSWLSAPGLHNQLGFGAIAGDAVWNQQARVRIGVGPVTFSCFKHFLPDGSAFPKLRSLAHYFVDRAFEFEVQVVLVAREVPWCRLDGGPDGARLGYSSWLKTAEFTRDAADLLMPAWN